MVSIVVEEPHRLLVRQDAERFEPEPNDVRIRVICAGICGSDLHILHGSNPFARCPRVIGHKFAGVVEALGDGVSALAIGQRVVVNSVVACGHCYPCRIGRPNVCGSLEVFGVHRDGGFRDRLTVPIRNCVTVPDDLAIEVAAWPSRCRLRPTCSPARASTQATRC